MITISSITKLFQAHGNAGRKLTSPVRTAAIILAALNLDLWYSIKEECINSTTVTTALMSKEVLWLALLT